jgi:hypothetical protein
MQSKSNMNQSTMGDRGRSTSGLIDQNLFVESLTLCAMEIAYGEEDPNPIEKVRF